MNNKALFKFAKNHGLDPHSPETLAKYKAEGTTFHAMLAEVLEEDLPEPFSCLVGTMASVEVAMNAMGEPRLVVLMTGDDGESTGELVELTHRQHLAFLAMTAMGLFDCAKDVPDEGLSDAMIISGSKLMARALDMYMAEKKGDLHGH